MSRQFALGCAFRTCENFWEQQTSSLVLSQKFSQDTKLPPQFLPLRFCALAQNLVKNNSCEAPENSPASWCKKSDSKGAVVPPADFLLEADKRGSPPKSEKRQLLARRGSGAGGAALLREKIGESKKQNSDFIVGFIKITDSIHLGFNP